MKAHHHEATCIYCLTTKSFSEFNKEHVIPQAFGQFRGALTLVRTVCAECNTYFNKELDLPLARQSFEGYQRYSRGVKSVEESNRFRAGTGLILRHPGPGEYTGALLRPVPGPKGLSVNLENQIMFVNPENGIGEPFTESDLKDPVFSEHAKGFVKWQIRIIADGDEVFDRLLDLLKRHGLTVEVGEPMGPPGEQGEMVNVKALVIVTELQMRAIAKIGFNYLSKIGGAELALYSEFNDTRAFIRYGIKTKAPIVHPDRSDFFDGETGLSIGGRIEGHFLHLVTEETPALIVAKVTLFNLMSYQVVLSDRDWPLRPKLTAFHAYNHRSRPMEVIAGVPLDKATPSMIPLVIRRVL